MTRLGWTAWFIGLSVTTIFIGILACEMFLESANLAGVLLLVATVCCGYAAGSCLGGIAR
jgi:hypothetical protein